MHLSKTTLLALLSFGSATLANIYPDQEPCQPAPKFADEYQQEYDTRMDLDYDRCDCVPRGPVEGEAEQEYRERWNIDATRCGTDVPDFVMPQFIPVGPLPVVVLGDSWRNPRHWRDDQWARRGPPPSGFGWGQRHPERGARAPWHRNGGGFPGGGRPGPDLHRGPEPGRPGLEPHREPPRPAEHRPEPPRAAEHRPEPPRAAEHRPEPPRPAEHRPEPGRRPGHP